MSDNRELIQAATSIREAVDALLSQRGIYKLSSHGWVGPDDIDPNEIGHAMWQMEDPADEVLMRDWYDTKPLRLEEWKTLCSVAGADFEGLMNSARLSIGYALLQVYELGDQLDSEDSLGSMYSRSAIMSLGAASDRIRDYFIAGFFRKSQAAYVNSSGEGASKRQRSKYEGPFAEALNLKTKSEQLSERLTIMSRMAAEVQKYRERRNFVVHQVATELGRMRMRVIESVANGTTVYEGWEKLTDADLFHIAEEQKKQANAQMQWAVEDPISWYKLLIEFAEHVFFVENRHRAASRSCES